MKKHTKRVVPVFATEAAEAKWWFANRDIHAKQMLDAREQGRGADTHEKEVGGKDRGVPEGSGASGGAADCRGGPGFGAKAG